MSAATWGLVAATFAACFVEMVEATTIVMAMGFTRSWRSALTGVAAALGLLVVVTSAAGYALDRWFPQTALQLVVGGLLLIFGLQWLRKAILRASGRKAVHDEDAIYRERTAAAEAAGRGETGLDMFSFMVSFKGVFLEGMEVVFIVITFGLNAKDVPAAGVGAAAAVVAVLGLAFAVRRPLSMIDENLLKYGVGLLLASFGTFWAVEGIGVFRAGRHGLAWPGGEAAVLGLLAVWFLLSRLFVAVLRVPAGPESSSGAPDRAARADAPDRERTR
ncbi:hypothetical protein [Actinacidiphila acididurans]|uniref:GDT1 family protein n=1 Tax=Actinacidiphila acididurans TaxID=2784346 RepID=A0ABS2U023_9ACTN|nr:hypothetical protein [Actinacidiphila acididurans]MBM9508677.1 hypothetical protein [Actinacidiphila acididurans]